jgi:DNA-binding beta-propeller fold protein YncE
LFVILVLLLGGLANVELATAHVFKLAFGSQGSGDGQFNLPFGVAVDGAGNVYVADTFNNRIQKLSSNGEFIFKFRYFW